MSDKMRWRYSDTNPVVAAVDAATVIEIGDLVYQDVDDAKPASRMEPPRTEAFRAAFLGVAMQRSQLGDADPLRVATTGVFEFDCPAGTFELGDQMAVDYTFPVDAAGPPQKIFLANQRISRAASPAAAIGRVAKRVSIIASTVFIEIRSTVMRG